MIPRLPGPPVGMLGRTGEPHGFAGSGGSWTGRADWPGQGVGRDHAVRPATWPPGSSASATAALVRLPTGWRSMVKLWQTATTISMPC